MSRYIFLFDLDSTITSQEIFPTISKQFGMFDEMNQLTESTMGGELPYMQGFLQKAELLKQVPVSKIRRSIGEIKLNDKMVEFIKKYHDRCYILTGNLDIWIDILIKEIGMEKNTFSSKAYTDGEYLAKVLSIVDKKAVASQIGLPFVAIGDGNNDAEMIEAAEIGIGYGGVKDIAPAILNCASHVFYNQDKLVEFLERLV